MNGPVPTVEEMVDVLATEVFVSGSPTACGIMHKSGA